MSRKRIRCDECAGRKHPTNVLKRTYCRNCWRRIMKVDPR